MPGQDMPCYLCPQSWTSAPLRPNRTEQAEVVSPVRTKSGESLDSKKARPLGHESSCRFLRSKACAVWPVQGLHRAQSDVELHRKDTHCSGLLSFCPSGCLTQECTEDDMGQASLSRAAFGRTRTAALGHEVFTIQQAFPTVDAAGRSVCILDYFRIGHISGLWADACVSFSM